VNEVALMYSGGLDTSYVALRLAEEFDRVHLVTFCNGMCFRPGASRKHVTLFRGMFGAEKFVHALVPSAPIFRELRKGLAWEMVRHRSPLLFDLCCRLSMETAAIDYCRRHGITLIADGSNPASQGEIFLQQEAYLETSRRYFAAHGISCIAEYNTISKRALISAELRKRGIVTGAGWLEKLSISSQLHTQPFCIWAPVPFFFTSFLRKLPFIRYFDLPVGRAIIFRRKKEAQAELILERLRRGKRV
jgi:hypothetical protein